MDPATAAVLACDLRRRILHPDVREEGGAYAAHALFDPWRSGLCVWTHADPLGAERPNRIREAVGEGYRPPDADALETARLMAARAHRAPSVGSATDAVGLWAAPPGGGRGLLLVTADDLAELAATGLAGRHAAVVTLD